METSLVFSGCDGISRNYFVLMFQLWDAVAGFTKKYELTFFQTNQSQRLMSCLMSYYFNRMLITSPRYWMIFLTLKLIY